jgi:hypothetical protein
VGDPRLGEPRRWGVFWIHHEAEELRVHHRTTIPAGHARALVVTLLASGRVPPLQATLFDRESAHARAWPPTVLGHDLSMRRSRLPDSLHQWAMSRADRFGELVGRWVKSRCEPIVASLRRRG